MIYRENCFSWKLFYVIDTYIYNYLVQLHLLDIYIHNLHIIFFVLTNLFQFDILLLLIPLLIQQ